MPKPGNHAPQTQVLEHDDSGGVYRKKVSLYAWDPDAMAPVRLSVNADGELNVVSGGHISTGNSSTTPLAGDATFTGTETDQVDAALIVVNVFSDVASAEDGLQFQIKLNGSETWRTADSYTIPANSLKTYSFQTGGEKFRVVYTNGSSAQSTFELETQIKHSLSKASSHRIKDTLRDNDDGELVVAVPKLRTAQDTYVSMSATTAGNQKVSLEEYNGEIANGGLPITSTDTPSVDAFGRWRVSNPETIFDSKNIFNDSDLADTVENLPLFFDNQETSGTGTGTTYNANKSSQSLTVSNATAGTRVRQTKRRFNYQPGKSQLIFLTFNMQGTNANIIKREGLYDDQNGLFLEFDGTTVNFVRRTYATGSAVDNEVAQANWNLDSMDGNGPSGINLDWTKTQIMIIDFEWLGVGRVRMGFVVDGMVYYAHEFLNTNVLDVVYMTTPNLPIRSEISNNGSGVADSITQICSTVISEGGSQDIGQVRNASTDGTHVDANTENTIYAVLGIRLKSNYIGQSIKLINASIQVHTASSKCEWGLYLNPTVAGTFTYTDEPLSAVQVARGATANTVTNGYRLAGGYVETGGAATGASGSATGPLDNAIILGSLIDGTVETMVLTVRPIGGSTSIDVEGSLTWRELT